VTVRTVSGSGHGLDVVTTGAGFTSSGTLSGDHDRARRLATITAKYAGGLGA
jgi:hypothetical protein